MYEHGIGNVSLYGLDCITKHDWLNWLCTWMVTEWSCVQTWLGKKLELYFFKCSFGGNMRGQQRRAKIGRVRGWIGCARAELWERGGSKEFGEPRNPYSLLNFNQEFRLGELNRNCMLLVILHACDTVLPWIFVFHMRGIRGWVLGTVLLMFSPKCMIMMDVCTMYAAIVQIWGLGDCIVFKLCRMFDAIDVSCFGMSGVWIGMLVVVLRAWSV